MPVLLIIILVALLSVGPQLWIRWVFFRYRSEQAEIRGTGGQLAEHLAKRYELEGLSVEETEPHRDCFDPGARAVRLSPENYHGRSLTAVAVAAHEIGHAIQCYREEPVFHLRKRYIPLARRLQQVGFLLLSISPILGVLTRSPAGLALPIIGGLLAALSGAHVYLIVLPEEWDASFYNALPLLREGDYISEAELPAVRRILRAAALTYFAAALASIVQIWRWLPFLLRR